MKKLWLEEKTGLLKELFRKTVLPAGRINLFILFIVFPADIFSQIQINGFCNYNLYTVNSGYSNLITMNFNGDSFTDLLLFNPRSKQITAVEGIPNGEFDAQTTSYLQYEINNIRIFDSKSFPFVYAFASRINMKAGLLEFRSTGRAVLRNSVNFDSYPENISVADVNNNGRNEMLISGGAFNGLSLVSQEGSRLSEKKVFEGTAFSQSTFIDLTNDGFSDIAAFEVLSGSFSFFYNNSLGEFRKARQISVFDSFVPGRTGVRGISSLRTFDINNDNYADLIFSSGSSVHIWYGDFRSSYENRRKIDTRFIPDKLIFGDFNNNGKTDIAYLNLENSVVSVLYAKNDGEFHPEIIYMHREGIKDIVSYSDKSIKGIAALNSSGKIHTITTFTSFDDDVSISIGGKPGAVTYFDSDNNGINDICFIDEFDKRIKFILRNKQGIPSVIYSYPLYENHSLIYVNNVQPGTVFHYVCYSPGQRLIEIIKADFKNKNIERTALYSPGLISDLKLTHFNKIDYNIYIAYTEKNKLSAGTFNYKDYWFTFTEFPDVVENVLDATVGSNGRSVYYWQTGSDGNNDNQNKISLFYMNLTTGEKPAELISLNVNNKPKIVSAKGGFIDRGNIFISFINDNFDYYTVVAADTVAGGRNNFIIKHSSNQNFRITSKNQLFFGETRFKGLKRLLFYQSEKKSVNQLNFNIRQRRVNTVEILNVQNIHSFFIKNMLLGDYHIVYTDTERNCITIKRIKG